MHLLSTMFSPTILPSTHSATSLHQHWPLLIWFTFCSFLSLLTWLLNLSTYPFISAPSILPILPAALTLSVITLQHHHELLFPLKLRTTLQLISQNFQNIWSFSSIVILLGKWHSLQHNWNPCCLPCISDSILLPLLLPVPISSQGKQATKWPHLCALLTNFFLLLLFLYLMISQIDISVWSCPLISVFPLIPFHFLTLPILSSCSTLSSSQAVSVSYSFPTRPMQKPSLPVPIIVWNKTLAYCFSCQEALSIKRCIGFT